MLNQPAPLGHPEFTAAERQTVAAASERGVAIASETFHLSNRRMSAVSLAITLAASMVLGGCQTAPVKAPQVAPAVVSLQEYMQQGAKAAEAGSRETARETYRAAAKAYPASKEPWVKLSGDYFEATDYGNAILAAQEVLLRDSSDNVAASVLAVSGLRLAVSALQTLRAQHNIAGSTRSEAETMTHTLREVLGENVLVPLPAPAPAAVAATPPKPSPKPRPKARTDAAAPAPSGSPSPAATPAPAAGNPFDKLK